MYLSLDYSNLTGGSLVIFDKMRRKTHTNSFQRGLQNMDKIDENLFETPSTLSPCFDRPLYTAFVDY